MKKPPVNKTEPRKEMRASPAPAPPPVVPSMPSRSAAGTGALVAQWFLSATARQANAMRKHVQKILDSQRDILQPKAIEAVSGGLAELRNAIASRADKSELLVKMENLEKIANDWLKPYPNAAWRENIEVLLVALTVAMAIRTFFLQPFKIPTGSMQPTLFGVTSVPDYTRQLERYGLDIPPKVQYPPFKQRI